MDDRLVVKYPTYQFSLKTLCVLGMSILIVTVAFWIPFNIHFLSPIVSYWEVHSSPSSKNFDTL